MCITEAWTYEQCSCRYDRNLPCVRFLSETEGLHPPTSSPHPPQNLAPLPHSLNSTTGSNCLSRSSSIRALDDEPHSRRACPDDRLVYRLFLEPICDVCLLEELRHKTPSPTRQTARDDSPQVENDQLILGSKVVIQVEADGQRRQMQYSRLSDLNTNEEGTHISHHGNCQSELAQSTSTFVSFKQFARRPSAIRTSAETSTTGRDADDEGPVSLRTSASSLASLLDRRRTGEQHRTTTAPSTVTPKQWCRRGIDVGRENFRISSRWTSGEKATMRNFRDALREATQDKTKGESAFSRFTKKETSMPARVKSIKKAVKSFRKSLTNSGLRDNITRSKSRMSMMMTRKDIIKDEDEGQAQRAARQELLRSQFNASRPDLLRSMWAVNESTDNMGSPRTRYEPSFTATPEPEDTYFVTVHRDSTDPGRESTPEVFTSWEEHLERDLARLRTRKKTIALRSHGDVNAFAQMPVTKRPSIPLLPKADVCFTRPDTPRRASRTSSQITDINDTPQRFSDAVENTRTRTRAESSDYSTAPTSISLSSDTCPLLDTPCDFGERLGEILSSREYSFNSAHTDEWSQSPQHGPSLSSSTTTATTTATTTTETTSSNISTPAPRPRPRPCPRPRSHKSRRPPRDEPLTPKSISSADLRALIPAPLDRQKIEQQRWSLGDVAGLQRYDDWSTSTRGGGNSDGAVYDSMFERGRCDDDNDGEEMTDEQMAAALGFRQVPAQFVRHLGGKRNTMAV